ncbi:MAG: DUF2769 domain-containing protein [Thermoplasmata archaeon]|nr:MAG: DUF2769 domain-containing protein [Thermoplasmata archaeon]
MEMSPEDMEQRKQMVFSLCICDKCPSWVECGEKGGFCLAPIGKSSCIKEEKGCTCGGCPVTEKLELMFMYYCTRGSAKEQGGM